MGFTEVLERLEYSYESEEAYDLVDDITEFISYHAIDESAQLAKERGSYPNYKGSGWSRGELPIDTIDMLEKDRKTPVKVSNKKRLDWEALRKKTSKGMRNSTLMAIAPTANISHIAGTTPGLDPQFAQIFSRSTLNGKFLEVNPNLVRELKKLDLWDSLKDEVFANQGDVQEIDGIPDEVKAVYKTSFQLSPYAFIEVAARAQKWVDQAISRNMYLETRDIDEYVKIYTEAWKRGLKTTYYLHVKPRHQSEQTTVSIEKTAQTKIKQQGGAARGHRPVQADLGEPDHVGVALADDDLVLSDRLVLGPVEAVEHLALAVHRRLGGVLVLGLRTSVAAGRGSRQDPATERGRTLFRAAQGQRGQLRPPGKRPQQDPVREPDPPARQRASAHGARQRLDRRHHSPRAGPGCPHR